MVSIKIISLGLFCFHYQITNAANLGEFDTQSFCVDEILNEPNIGTKFIAELPDGAWDGSCSDSSLQDALNSCRATINMDTPQNIKLACRILLDPNFIPFGILPVGYLLDEPLSTINFANDLNRNVFSTCELLHLINDSCFYYTKDVLPVSYTFSEYATASEYEKEIYTRWRSFLTLKVSPQRKFAGTEYDEIYTLTLADSLRLTYSLFETNISSVESKKAAAIQHDIWENQIGRLSVNSCFQGSTNVSRYINPEFIAYFDKLRDADSVTSILNSNSFNAIALAGFFVPTLFQFGVQYAATTTVLYDKLVDSSTKKITNALKLTRRLTIANHHPSYTYFDKKVDSIKNNSETLGLDSDVSLVVSEVGGCDIPLLDANPDSWESILLGCAVQRSGDIDGLPPVSSIPPTGFRHIFDIVQALGVKINPLIPQAMQIYYRFCNCEESNHSKSFSCFYANGTVWHTESFANCQRSYWHYQYVPDFSIFPDQTQFSFVRSSPNQKFSMIFNGDLGILMLVKFDEDGLSSPLWAICLDECMQGNIYMLQFNDGRMEMQTRVTSNDGNIFAKVIAFSDALQVPVYNLNNDGKIQAYQFGGMYEATLTYNQQTLDSYSLKNVESYLPFMKFMSTSFEVTSPNGLFQLKFFGNNGTVVLYDSRSLSGNTVPLWSATAPSDEGRYFSFVNDNFQTFSVCTSSNSCVRILTLISVNCASVKTPFAALDNDGSIASVNLDTTYTPSPCGYYETGPDVQWHIPTNEVSPGNQTRSFSVFSPSKTYKFVFNSNDCIVMMYGLEESGLETPLWYTAPSDDSILAPFNCIFSNDDKTSFFLISKTGYNASRVYKEVTNRILVETDTTCDYHVAGRRMFLEDDGTFRSFFGNTYCGEFDASPRDTLRVSTASLVPMGVSQTNFSVVSPSHVYTMSFSSEVGSVTMHRSDLDEPLWNFIPHDDTITQVTGHTFVNNNISTLATSTSGTASGSTKTSQYDVFQSGNSDELCGSKAVRRMQLEDDGVIYAYANGMLCDALTPLATSRFVPLKIQKQSFTIESQSREYKLAFSSLDGSLTMYHVDQSGIETTIWVAKPQDSAISRIQGFEFQNNGMNSLSTILRGYGNSSDGVKEVVVEAMTEINNTGKCGGDPRVMILENDGTIRSYFNQVLCGTLQATLQVSRPYMVPRDTSTQSFVVTSPNNMYQLTYMVTSGSLMLSKSDDSGVGLPLWSVSPLNPNVSANLDLVERLEFVNDRQVHLSTIVHYRDALYEDIVIVATEEANSTRLCDASQPRDIFLGDDGIFRSYKDTVFCGTLMASSQVNWVPASSLVPMGTLRESFVVTSPQYKYKLAYSSSDGRLMMYQIQSFVDVPLWHATPHDNSFVVKGGFEFTNDNMTTLSAIIYGQNSQGTSVKSLFRAIKETSNSHLCGNGPRRIQLDDDGKFRSYRDAVHCGTLEAAPQVRLISNTSLVPMGIVRQSFVVTSPQSKHKLAYSSSDGRLMMYRIEDSVDVPLWHATPPNDSFVEIDGFEFSNDNTATLSSTIYGKNSQGTTLKSLFKAVKETNNSHLCGNGPRRIQLDDDGKFQSYRDAVHCGTLEAAPQVSVISNNSLVPMGLERQSFVVTSPQNMYKLAYSFSDGRLMMYRIEGSVDVPLWHATPHDDALVKIDGLQFSNDNTATLSSTIYGKNSQGTYRESLFRAIKETNSSHLCGNEPRRIQLDDDGKFRSYRDAVHCGTLEAAPQVRIISNTSLVPMGIVRQSFAVTSPRKMYKLAYSSSDGRLMMYRIEGSVETPLWFTKPHNNDSSIYHIMGYEFMSDDLASSLSSNIYGMDESLSFVLSMFIAINETSNSKLCSSGSRRIQLDDDGMFRSYRDAVHCSTLEATPQVTSISNNSLVPMGTVTESFVVTSPQNKYKLTYSSSDGNLIMYRNDGSVDIPIWYTKLFDNSTSFVEGYKFTNDNMTSFSSTIYGKNGSVYSETLIVVQETNSSNLCGNEPRRMQLDDDGKFRSYQDAKLCGILEEVESVVQRVLSSPTSASITSLPSTLPPSTQSPTSTPTTSPTTSTPTTSPTTSTPTTSPTQGVCMNGRYAQCGGLGFEGETCCDEGLICNVISDTYSQCGPDPQRLCILQDDPCITSPNNCCGTLTCQGDQFFKMCAV